MIKYRVRAIQRRQLLIVLLGLGIGFVAVSFGIDLLIGLPSLIGGLLTLGFGIIAIFSILQRVQTAIPLAMHMSSYLNVRIKQFAE